MGRPPKKSLESWRPRDPITFSSSTNRKQITGVYLAEECRADTAENQSFSSQSHLRRATGLRTMSPPSLLALVWTHLTSSARPACIRVFRMLWWTGRIHSSVENTKHTAQDIWDAQRPASHRSVKTRLAAVTSSPQVPWGTK